MKRSVQIYVENIQLDLFDDEEIQVTSSVQNISDISKVFTDFSQSFTIPCSPTNNYVFEHYYNNDVDTEINHQERRSARIEIDHSPFRTGKVQLEKGQLKNGQPENYSVTFYGDVVTLKDLIGEDKLADLDYSSLDHTYSGAEVQTRIETDPSSTDYDVKYPLISSRRVWQYGSADSNDISLNTSPIDYTELFPAVRTKKIFDFIETKYGVTFTGAFLNSKPFTQLFTWFKNKEQFTFYTPSVDLVFAVGDPETDFITDSQVKSRRLTQAEKNALTVAPYDSLISSWHKCTVEINTASSDDYILDTYKNGILYNSQSGNGNQSFNILGSGVGGYISNESLPPANNPDIYTFKLRSTAALTFDANISYDIKYTLYDNAFGGLGFLTSYTSETASVGSTSTSGLTDLKSLAPDIKISDFLGGVFNMFNLTCYGEDATTFRIEPLETFYANGIDYNITEYTLTDEITIERPKLYKTISFEYEDSESFMNLEFVDLFKRKYSSLNASFNYDGGDFIIKLPFETLLHQKFTGNNLQVGYSLGTEPEYKNYIPKCVMLYANEWQDTDVSFYLDNGTTTDLITEYVPFGQDAYNSPDNISINFGADISSFLLEPVYSSLYQTYYQTYINNLYDPKTRVVYVKTVLPLDLLTSIGLNDSLIIRDKKYVINEMKSSLTTGEVDLVLLSNWRASRGLGRDYVVTSDGGAISVPFSTPKSSSVIINLESGTGFSTFSDTTPTGQTTLTVTYTANPSASEREDIYSIQVTNDKTGGKTIDWFIITQNGFPS